MTALHRTYRVVGRLDRPDPRRSDVIAGEGLSHDAAIGLAREMEDGRGANGWWWSVRPDGASERTQAHGNV